MDDLTRRLMLFDFYGDLLTDKQREVYDLYYQKDLSLGEIAELWHVSRASVYDLLHRTDKTLGKYEKALALLDGFIKREQICKSLTDYIKENIEDIPELFKAKLEVFISELMELE